MNLEECIVEISSACKTIRAWSDFLAPDSVLRVAPDGLQEATLEVKRYLEHARCDGKPIRELEIAEYLLITRQGVQWVMPFVLSAESMEARRRAKKFS